VCLSILRYDLQRRIHRRTVRRAAQQISIAAYNCKVKVEEIVIDRRMDICIYCSCSFYSASVALAMALLLVSV